ncbi:S24 family peptidase [Pseudomonas aeruginosa]|uniref:XRE family transcriptional regulator n=1 Tax=Pseudomonas aeruginosa TaxID=287 RepID=UPI0015C00702|nr:S24 family peptidase [Pseudomonas aeruginosa]EKW5974327.1 c repressor [Pseudomonas aeruginosa]EMB5660470.1 c repressor [Pseudomonas aeruginosa]MBX6198402.1 c repressor [Pseudomonas aeruginosa]MBX6760776.1 c repressor [Pseudomonas aeruginosa]MBX6792728.1 c repressor [Pseudomonas aeruginosa]
MRETETDSSHPIPCEGIGCFSERLGEIISSQSLRGFSAKCGLSTATLRSYLNSETYPTLDRLAMIAEAASVSPIWLAFGTEVSQTKAADDEDEVYAYIPLYEAKVSAGSGSWTGGTRILTHLAFTRYSLRRKGLTPSDLSAVRVDGDSMAGMLDDGDTVMIDHSRNTLEGEAVYVLRLDGHLYAKRVQRQINGALAIISANPAYETMYVSRQDLDAIEIIGRVVWAGRWMV